jgi:hypothetical protein
MEVSVHIDHQTRGEVMSNITTVVSQNTSMEAVAVVGIDLTKNVFAAHGINAAGKPVLVRPAARRDQLLGLLAQLPLYLIGMEACNDAHH